MSAFGNTLGLELFGFQFQHGHGNPSSSGRSILTWQLKWPSPEQTWSPASSKFCYPAPVNLYSSFQYAPGKQTGLLAIWIISVSMHHAICRNEGLSDGSATVRLSDLSACPFVLEWSGCPANEPSQCICCMRSAKCQHWLANELFDPAPAKF